MSNALSLSKLPAADKDTLVRKLATKVSQLDQLAGDLCEELHASRSLCGRPQIKLSEMERATTPKPTGRRDKRRSPGKMAPKVAVDHEIVKAAVSAGSSFKDYED